jgi:excisionase family DNA binding protein
VRGARQAPSRTGLSAIRASAAGQRLDPLYLFARLLVYGGVAEVDVPVQARVRGVLFFGGWVRFGCARLCGVHSDLQVCVGRVPGCSSTCGAVSLYSLIILLYNPVCSLLLAIGQRGVVDTATEELLSPEEVGERLGVSVYTVRRWIKEGKLRAFRPGKEYRVRLADLEEFFRTREVHPKAGAPPEARQRTARTELRGQVGELGEPFFAPTEEGEELETIEFRFVRLLEEKDRLLQRIRTLERELEEAKAGQAT